MKTYYIAVNNTSKGPYSIEELKGIGISKSTLVWKEGLENWCPAENINELKDVFKVIPPPIPTNNQDQNIIDNTVNVVLQKPAKPQIEQRTKKLEQEKIKINTAKEIKTNLLLVLIAIACSM